MPKLTITVFLSPNEKFKPDPDPTWPKPQGVRLRLTAKAGKTKPVDLAATDSEGVTSYNPPANTTYQVMILDDDFKGWWPAGEVSVKADDCEKDVVLIPEKGRWLLPLLLCHFDDTGKPRAGASRPVTTGMSMQPSCQASSPCLSRKPRPARGP
jgi:hypothetical protein